MTPPIPIVYVGLDIAKASLQLDLLGKSFDFSNTPSGHSLLLKKLASIAGVQVVCEATGGYERALTAFLQSAQVPVSVINPARVRQFARARGTHAKTDPIDARVLSAFGSALAPQPTPARTPTESTLAAYVSRRLQLISMRVAETQRAEACLDQVLAKDFVGILRYLENAIAKINTLIKNLVRENPLLRQQVARLEEITGVGLVSAVSVLAELPELGSLTKGQAAALAGCVFRR